MKRSLFFILSIVLFSAVGAFEARAQENLVSTSIVINEVYGGAGCTTAGCSVYNRDFVELKNISASPVDVTGWSVQYASGTSTNPTWSLTPLTGTIAPGAVYLVAGATGAAGTGVNTLPNPNVSGTLNLSATTGKVALVNNATAITAGTLCPIPTASIIDFVGYGAQAAGTLCAEGTVTAAPSTQNSVARNASGTDTDNNAADFTVGAPTPAGSAVTPTSSAAKKLFDFDGDAKTDISIFRPAPGEWWINRSSNGTGYALQFGSSTDNLVPADYTGDGKTDVAVWRPSTGTWYVLRSEDSSFYSAPFGANGDVPAPGDYDGDNKADFAVFRPSTNTWYINKSSGGTDITAFGTAGDVPVVADYDGDGKSDIAIFRPAPAEWWVLRSTAGLIAFQFGATTDKPVPADYTGDGKADVAIFRPSSGTWFVLRSEDASFYGFPFGANGDLPVPGDYDGDGKFDAGVFRVSDNTWYVSRSTAGTLIQAFGIAGDKPLPNVYVP
jgi:hypothetical protein